MSGKSEKTLVDSGSQSRDHYRIRLPRWRLAVREFLIPIVRYETPIIAQFQQKFQTPGRDVYFALAANLGTHTFFMVMLPVLYWCGHTGLCRAFSQMLASGVFWSGFVKDLVCLPRPLSPPVQRISRSASAVLEYGFPSTHSTNALSVTVYLLYLLHKSDISGWLEVSLQGLIYAYALSIVVGRVYCGMHGFFDVTIGTLLGILIAVVQIVFGDWFDFWIHDDSIRNVLLVILIVLVLVRIHPEPADDCPCFDDSVAFSGVMIGLQVGAWHFSGTGFAAPDGPLPYEAPFSLEKLGYPKSVLRIILGVLTVFVWRGSVKYLLLKFLPPLFRLIEDLGLSLPRKYFLKASEYRSVPPLRKDDNVIPTAREIPAMLGSLTQPRKRTISVGPQSEADAYEAIAHRDRVRRESLTKNERPNVGSTSSSNYYNSGAAPDVPVVTVTSPQSSDSPNSAVDSSSGEAPGVIVAAPKDPSSAVDFPTPEEIKVADELEDRAMFARLQVPRVRYDVEVVTKLIVYAGIGFIAADAGPILFEFCGLSVGIHPW